jgi:hypothetical protein
VFEVFTKEFVKDGASQFKNFHMNVFEIIIVRLNYHKFCARSAPKILMGVHETHRMT